ncbi:MAG TPA: DUF2937 family protein [Opitutus sp.]|nr:DUF2937 family protein [Opitutus sp.]
MPIPATPCIRFKAGRRFGTARFPCQAMGYAHHSGMRIGRAALGAGDRLLDRALCVVGAVAFSQFPEFMQQYLQRLGGHLDEARRELAQFRHAAAQSGLTLDQLIHQTAVNSDAAVARLGGVMTDAVDRVNSLEAAQSALLHASAWTRPFVFFQHVDPGIAHNTWTIFKPAVPTTPEGLAYALLGIFVLLGVYHLGLKWPIRRIARRRRARLEAIRQA